MLIDWFTIGAQALNFLVLVWLMKRFLYKPILNAIEERENRIAKELSDAAAQQTEAHKEQQEFRHKNEQFDKHHAALLKKATEDAQVERQRLQGEARDAASALSSKRLEALKNEEQNLYQSVSRRTQQEVFAIARKVLTDLAGASLEERLVAVFTQRLQDIEGELKASLANSLKIGSEPVLMRCAFDLPPEQQAVIQNALNETFAVNIQIRFETAQDLICGIELIANGQKVAWSIKEYLLSLEQGVNDLMNENDQPTRIADSDPKVIKNTELKSDVKAKPEPIAKVVPHAGNLDTEQGRNDHKA